MTDKPDFVSRRKFITAAAGASALGIAGCVSESGSGGEGGDGTNTDGGNGGSGELSGTVEIAGSSTVFPLAEAVSVEFRKEHPNVEFNIRSTGSGGGFSDFFCQDKTHFNNASRPMKESEKQLCEDAGVEWLELNVATDALTVVVNNEADWVDCVTIDELKQIWEPNGATKWSDVRDDWPDEEFELYGAASTSGTFDYFTEAVIGEAGSHRQDYTATEKDRSIVQGVTGSKNAMGYFGFSYYYNNPEAVKAVKIDNGDGCIEPSLETAKSGKYTPLARPLFTYPKKSALKEPHVAEFAKFFVEKSADQEIVANQVGYVPNTEEDMQEQLDQLTAAIEEVQG
ncbi:PstS family phosphate ABC transporter substrate-binding protein [Haladaptatus sp. CMSO5]|uniref:PstS family phosphate ABC transporter substrate-binding protein n=1 Tax=Haladaptatus sp. CMSO5 TaxID=3120514 RepID=UPI002FCE01C7